MAWPITRSTGFLLSNTAWNEIVNALSQDGGNRNGGGYTYSNIIINTALAVTAGSLTTAGAVSAGGLVTATGGIISTKASAVAAVSCLFVQNSQIGVYGAAIEFRATDSVTSSILPAARCYGVFDAATFADSRWTVQLPTGFYTFVDIFSIKATMMRHAALPSANPGAGTKQFWYDPTDSNRVKYAV